MKNKLKSELFSSKKRGGGGGGGWYPNAHYEQSKQSQSNNKVLWKEMPPNYHQE